MTTTAVKRDGTWNNVPILFNLGLRPVESSKQIPAWVYELRPGDELMSEDGKICIFERSMQKNIAFIDSNGKSWRGTPYRFMKWRSGDPAKITAVKTSNPCGYKTDETAARSLQPGDIALFIMGPKRIYIARIEETANAKSIAACDLNGKACLYPLDSFVMKLPADKFPKLD